MHSTYEVIKWPILFNRETETLVDKLTGWLSIIFVWLSDSTYSGYLAERQDETWVHKQFAYLFVSVSY